MFSAARVAELHAVQQRVLSVACEQFCVFADFDDASFIEHGYLIGVFDRRESMRDHRRFHPRGRGQRYAWRVWAGARPDGRRGQAARPPSDRSSPATGASVVGQVLSRK